jgi:hypothetical protein
MMLRKILLGFTVFLAGFLPGPVHAQLKVNLAAERSTFLLYEPMVLTVQLANTSGERIVLNSGPQDRPWLSFLVIGADGRKARAEQALSLDPVVLEPGQSKLLSVDVTPLYAIRETGQYTVQVSVQPPGRSAFLTDALVLSVGKGDTIWNKNYVDGGTKREVSLIRFIDRKDVSLYLRVEEPQENLVYSTVRLGRVVAFTSPQVELDGERGIHVLHPVGARTYRYTRANAEGSILSQEDRESGVTPPTLAARPGGKIEFVGGVQQNKPAERPKLSTLQQGI